MLDAVFSLDQNIFPTLFQIALIISMIKDEDRHRHTRSIIFYITYQSILSIVLWYCLYYTLPLHPYTFRYHPIINALTGGIIDLEGGLFWLLYGVIIWKTKRNPRLLTVSCIALSAVYAPALSPLGGELYQQSLNMIYAHSTSHRRQRLSSRQPSKPPCA